MRAEEGESAKSMVLADFIKRDDGTMIPKSTAFFWGIGRV